MAANAGRADSISFFLCNRRRPGVALEFFSFYFCSYDQEAVAARVLPGLPRGWGRGGGRPGAGRVEALLRAKGANEALRGRFRGAVQAPAYARLPCSTTREVIADSLSGLSDSCLEDILGA